jgi:predicted XRE-type DNA-binding protein
VRAPGLEQELKEQLARELCTILDGYQRDAAAARVDAHESELSRLRHGDLRRFSLARIVRYIARAGYDVEVHLKRTPRFEERPTPRHHPASTVLRYDYYGCKVPP